MSNKIPVGAHNRFLSQEGAKQIIDYIGDVRNELLEAIGTVSNNLDLEGRFNEVNNLLTSLDTLVSSHDSGLEAVRSGLTNKPYITQTELQSRGQDITLVSKFLNGAHQTSTISLTELLREVIGGEIVDSANICYLQLEDGKYRAGDYNRGPGWKPLDRTDGTPHYVNVVPGVPANSNTSDVGYYRLDAGTNETSTQYLILTFKSNTGYIDLCISLKEITDRIVTGVSGAEAMTDDDIVAAATLIVI